MYRMKSKLKMSATIYFSMVFMQRNIFLTLSGEIIYFQRELFRKWSTFWLSAKSGETSAVVMVLF